MKQPISAIHKGDLVRVVWHDACEGPLELNLSEMGVTRLRNCIPTTLTTVGRYLRVLNGYLILDDVIREESNGKMIFERQAEGKWLSIPLGVINQVTPLGDIDQIMLGQINRRRTIFKQLRFIPRSKRLATGELSRILYLT